MRYPNGLAITWRNADRLGTANNATTTNGNSIHGEQDNRGIDMANTNEQMIVALDIGTSKVVAIVGAIS